MAYDSKTFILNQVARGAHRISLYNKRQQKVLLELRTLGYVSFTGELIQLTPKGHQVTLYGMVFEGEDEADDNSIRTATLFICSVILVLLIVGAIGYYIGNSK